MFPAVEEPETGKTPVIAAAAAVVEGGKKVPSQAKDAQEIRRKEKEEKIVAIVTEGQKEYMYALYIKKISHLMH